jgi:hypothetical protein
MILDSRAPSDFARLALFVQAPEGSWFWLSRKRRSATPDIVEAVLKRRDREGEPLWRIVTGSPGEVRGACSESVSQLNRGESGLD